MILTLDIGNTRGKYVFWEDRNNVAAGFWNEWGDLPVEKLQKTTAISWCTTANSDPDIPRKGTWDIFHFQYGIRLPFKNNYKTPETLGQDRMASVFGASLLFPDSDILVIDAGTCITTDLMTGSDGYMGGSISPGLTMRYRAMNEYTGKLPLLKPEPYESVVGNSTDSSMHSGVFQGVLGELNYRIHNLLKKHEDLKVILTGGDAEFLADHLKYRIFAEPFLTHIGLLNGYYFNAI